MRKINEKIFYPNTKMFVNCEDCLFFVHQKQLLSNATGICTNKFAYSQTPQSIYNAKTTSCGCSIPKNYKGNIEEYYSKDNSDTDPYIRKDV